MPSCPHCLAGKATEEIAGFRFHAFSDRWISCNGVDQRRMIVQDRHEVIGRMGNAFHSISVSNFIRLRRRLYIPDNP